ncbi:MAG: acetylornithine deacetylase [Acidobacteriaceae bacterium]
MKSVVELLAELIRIPSVSELSNRPIVDYVRRVLAPVGWKFREQIYRDLNDIQKVNLIAAPPGADIEATEVDFAFVCHSDTVPYAASWTNATNPVERDGNLHGCGACDVKGYLACLLTAALSSASQPISSGLRLLLTADEEVGCVGTMRLMDAGCIRPRRVLIGEPTSLHPARAGKGYCLAEISVVGKESHSAHPQQGTSAIYAAMELIAEIRNIAKSLEEERNTFFNPSFATINVGTIHGGTAKNIVPGRCNFQLEWRPLPNQSGNTVIEQVRKLAQRLEHQWSGQARYDIRVTRTQPGFESPENAELVHQLQTFTGKPSMAIPFGSEAPYFAQVAEEVVVFGPGDMKTAHSERECIPLDELNAAVSVMQHLMKASS